MTNASPTTLVLGGTGKTGARVASRLTGLGHYVRTAARHGAATVLRHSSTPRTSRRSRQRRSRTRVHTRAPSTLLADEVVFDYIITVPSYPRHVVGRAAVAELYRPYGETFVMNRCFDLAVHRDRETGVVVLEYSSEGRVVETGGGTTSSGTTVNERASYRRAVVRAAR